MERVLALTDKKGNSLLHVACAFGFAQLVLYFLDRGADPYMQNMSIGERARDEIVVGKGSHQTKQRKGKNDPELPPVARKTKDTYGQDDAGMKTPYHICCEIGHSHIFKMFITKGIDTSGRDEAGYTCLHFAATNNDVECATLQLDNTRMSSGQYRPEPKSKAGWTPMHCAALHDSVHVIVLLLDARASPWIENKDGKSPMDLAIRDRTKQALTGHLKKILQAEAREKEARLKAMVDERKKKMIELEKQVRLQYTITKVQ